MKFFRAPWRNPLTTTESLVAVSTVVGGIYALAVSLGIQGAEASASLLTQSIGVGPTLDIFAVVYLLSGLTMIYGLVLDKKKLRTSGLFVSAMCRFYTVISFWLVFGLLPLFWLGTFTVALISFSLWWHYKVYGTGGKYARD